MLRNSCPRQAGHGRTWWPLPNRLATDRSQGDPESRYGLPLSTRRVAVPVAGLHWRKYHEVCPVAGRRRSWRFLYDRRSGPDRILFFASTVFRLGGNRIVDQLRQPDSALDRFVIDKVQFRDDPQLEALGQIRAKITGGVLQAASDPGNGFGATQRGKEHLGMMMIAADLDASQRHHPDSGVLQLGSNQFRQILLDLVRYATEPGRIFRHLLYRVKVECAARDKLNPSMLPVMDSEAARDFNDFVSFQLIADLQIVEVLYGQAALESCFYFSDIVLEAIQ